VGTGVITKLTLKVADMPLPPDTDTVAVFVPAESPLIGLTVKLALPPTAILGIDVADSVKLLASVPESVTLNAPVDWFPVFITVTVNGVCVT